MPEASKSEKDLPVIKTVRTGKSLTRPMRKVKMIKPLCPEECQIELGPGWWNECPHDPYFHEDDRLGRQPNLRQVPATLKVGSGIEPAYLIEIAGYKTLEDLGYDPMCEFNNCWGKPTLNTRYGAYCTEAEAKRVALVETETPIIINNQRLMEQQMNGVAL